ncbi:FAD-binding domain-containing protein [Massarina eburnea CBS 473.64]|uniref:FAD-binding domain-containing protein n=1 Tax=Massarina eburnea CBS 473.64 TaxID=1395130 RepID=A0A6A6S158_9PLEO|nr:FAD-binding domain-containing protein [Massarina eburnea CBS 473.64]
MFRPSFALLAAALLNVTRAQNETKAEPATHFLPPGYCCTVLTISDISERVTYPGQSAYEASLASYFDGKSRLTPDCIVQPKTAEEVSTAVKVLVSASLLKPCEFAVRSGGHTPIPGSNNVDNGVTIDLLYMNGTSYNVDTEVASISPAARWGSVYQTLEPLGRMVAGGRGSTVGVGGYLLGGGISHYAPRVGLSCDNVLNFQVVLADGRILDANKNTNADLFTALKGGSSNFGIVTRYDMETFQSEDLWAGIVSYPAWTADQHFKALVNFGLKPNRDPNAALIIFQGYSTASPTDVVRAAFDYTKPLARPDAYREFFAITNNISDTTKIQPMSSVAAEFTSVTTNRVQFRTLSFKIDLATLQETARLYKILLLELQTKASGQWRISCLHQVWSTLYTANSTARGGNVLGMERYTENFIMYQSYLSWSETKDDELFINLGLALTDGIQKFAASKGTAVEYLYLNYADKDQDPLSAYGADKVKFMKTVAREYDPLSIYQTLLPGGFKISNV